MPILDATPRATTTVQCACSTTDRLTEPSSHWLRALRPRAPTTTVDACPEAATNAPAAEPWTTLLVNATSGNFSA